LLVLLSCQILVDEPWEVVPFGSVRFGRTHVLLSFSKVYKVETWPKFYPNLLTQNGSVCKPLSIIDFALMN
jgi:hypothetical protein